VADQQADGSLPMALLDEADLRWQLSLIWRAGSALSPAARAWIDLVTQKNV
jgi:DNA-binding transcriptional LysR family regulator